MYINAKRKCAVRFAETGEKLVNTWPNEISHEFDRNINLGRNPQLFLATILQIS